MMFPPAGGGKVHIELQLPDFSFITPHNRNNSGIITGIKSEHGVLNVLILAFRDAGLIPMRSNAAFLLRVAGFFYLFICWSK